MPVDASRFDAVVCHAYKWLCAPRGVAFLTLSDRLQRLARPVFAGWYAGEDPWSSCYGHEVELAASARRFDVSPAWQAFVGAEPAIALFADADRRELYEYTTGLAASFRERCGIPQPERPSAIVTWQDPTGCDLARLSRGGYHRLRTRGTRPGRIPRLQRRERRRSRGRRPRALTQRRPSGESAMTAATITSAHSASPP